MRKVTFVVNALTFDEESLDFIADVAGDASEVTGLFLLDTVTIGDTPEVKMLVGQAYVEEIVHSPFEQEEIENIVRKNIGIFLDGCSKRGVRAIAKEEKGNPQDIVKLYSRFSDIIVMSPHLSFYKDNNIPTDFAEDLLTHTECPILLSPERYTPIDEVVIAYDGSKTSMFALKQFCYQMQHYCTNKVTVLYINEGDEKNNHVANEGMLSEWLSLNCSSITFESLSGDARDVLFNYFLDNEDSNNKLLVAGGFGRSAVSRFFKPSTTDLVLKTADIPVFISHR